MPNAVLTKPPLPNVVSSAPVAAYSAPTEVGRTGNSIDIGESGLSSRHNVAICLEGDGEGLSEDMAREWRCNATVGAKAVIDSAVGVVADEQKARNASTKCQARRSSESAGGDDLGAIRCRVGRNDKSACAIGREARSLPVNTEGSIKTAIRSVEGGNTAAPSRISPLGRSAIDSPPTVGAAPFEPKVESSWPFASKRTTMGSELNALEALTTRILPSVCTAIPPLAGGRKFPAAWMATAPLLPKVLSGSCR